MVKPAIGVVGLGTMGLGIAQVFAQAGHIVRATDQAAASRENAKTRLRDQLAPRVAAGKMAAADLEGLLGRLEIVEDTGGLAGSDMVVEAIVEDLDAKTALFRNLETLLDDRAILATNTSALSVSELARSVARPGRVLGLHFFNPAPVMKLVELVTGDQTDADAMTRAEAMTTAAGKVVIRCADRPGFIVNRCARPYYGEALAMLEEGRTASEIDAAMLSVGYRLGPFSLIDLIGADINLAATMGLYRGMDAHPRYYPFQSLRDQVARGDLGRKTGRGALFPDVPGAAPADAEQIVLRIEATLANEAASLLAEGTVSAEDIDRAMMLGVNYPRGPLEGARRHGIAKICAVLEALEARAPAHLKGRYAVSAALKTLP